MAVEISICFVVVGIHSSRVDAHILPTAAIWQKGVTAILLPVIHQGIGVDTYILHPMICKVAHC